MRSVIVKLGARFPMISALSGSIEVSPISFISSSVAFRICIYNKFPSLSLTGSMVHSAESNSSINLSTSILFPDSSLMSVFSSIVIGSSVGSCEYPLGFKNSNRISVIISDRFICVYLLFFSGHMLHPFSHSLGYEDLDMDGSYDFIYCFLAVICYIHLIILLGMKI